MIGKKDRVPEGLRTLFIAEIADIATSIQRKISLTLEREPDNKINTEEIADLTVGQWIKDKLVAFAYGRYEKLMESLGEKPYSQNGFRALGPRHPNAGIQKAPYECFRDIEKKGIKPGMKVTYTPWEGQQFEVLTVSRLCQLSIRNTNGEEKPISSVSPFSVEVVIE